MKTFGRILLVLSCTAGTTLSLSAQTAADAYHFSTAMSLGTARGQALGGAVGALGGEVSAIYVNPATIGFFRNRDISVTIAWQGVQTANYYLGNRSDDKRNNLKFDNFTLMMRSDDKSQPKTVFAIGVNRINSFNENVFYQGNSNMSRSVNYVLKANAVASHDPDDLLNTDDVDVIHGAGLAYSSYLINPYREGDVYKFRSAVEAADHSILVNQSHNIRTSGGTNELSLILGKQRNEQLSLGGTLNIDFIRHEQSSTWTETNINPQRTDLNYFQLNKLTRTNGIGVNLKFGAIYKPVPQLNLGLVLQSPTWYGMNVDYQSNILTETKSHGQVTASTIYMVDDTTQSQPDHLTYNITAPWKGTLSAVLLINAAHSADQLSGFVSADYEFDDYGSLKLKYGTALDDRYRKQEIQNTYTSASNIRLGGELRYLLFAMRLGYAYYGNPYKNGTTDGARTYYSGGIGYRANGYYLDLSLIAGGNQQRKQLPYEVLSNNYGYVNPPMAQVTSAMTRVALTWGVKF